MFVGVQHMLDHMLTIHVRSRVFPTMEDAAPVREGHCDAVRRLLRVQGPAQAAGKGLKCILQGLRHLGACLSVTCTRASAVKAVVSSLHSESRFQGAAQAAGGDVTAVCARSYHCLAGCVQPAETLQDSFQHAPCRIALCTTELG